MKIDNWKICHWPILAVYLEDLFCRRKSINENFVNWKLRPLLFLKSWFNAFFHLKSSCQRALRLLFGDCRFIYFHLLMKLGFLLSEGLLCLYDRQNNTWLLVEMEFLFSCSTRHLTRSLHSLLSYRLEHVWAQRTSEMSIWTRGEKLRIYKQPCIILSII